MLDHLAKTVIRNPKKVGSFGHLLQHENQHPNKNYWVYVGSLLDRLTGTLYHTPGHDAY